MADRPGVGPFLPGPCPSILKERTTGSPYADGYCNGYVRGALHAVDALERTALAEERRLEGNSPDGRHLPVAWQQVIGWARDELREDTDGD